MSIRARIDLSDTQAKRLLLDAIRSMDGEHRVEVVRYRPRRSDRQNRWYWPGLVQPFAEWLAEQNGTMPDEEAAHSIFKETFLRIPVCDDDGAAIFLPNGDPMMRTRSTTELTTTEFNQYLDHCGKLMMDLRVTDEMPEPIYEREAA